MLKCHPDKVQDVALKAIKQDEFQKVQQAYELLSDENRRSQYDEQCKLFQLRKEMGKGNQPYGKNVFDYEIRTAEPRSSSFRSSPREPTKVYAQQSPRSFEDIDRSSEFESSKARARKTASYEERRRPATRDGDSRRKSEEERDYERWEKDARRAAHGTAKKSRDKERKKGSEEKFSRSTAAFVVDASDSEDEYPLRTERKSSRERHARASERPRKDDQVLTERTRKVEAAKDFAAQYMQAARRKAEAEMDFRPKPLRRAETFQETSYNIRTAAPPSPYLEEDDYVRRSSAQRSPPRRSSEQIPIRTREPRPSGKERKLSSSYEREAHIVDASPSSPTMPSMRKPALQSHSSAPPVIASMSGSRKEPHRSKTLQSEYVRRESAAPPPPLPRAATFQAGDKNKSASKGSKLKTHMAYVSDDSESDSPAPRYSPRPSTPPRRRGPETTRYVIEKDGRPIPVVTRHSYRTDLREDDYRDSRDRSESPLGTRRSNERPPVMRSGGSGSHPSSPRDYFSPEPIIKEVRPKMANRESSGSGSTRSPYFGEVPWSEVKYARQYGPADVSFSDPYRRGSDGAHHHGYPLRAVKVGAYAG